MGLIISVILVCVGVYEFVQLFCDAGGKVECQTKKICSIGDESIKKDPTPKIKLCRDFLSHEDVEVECPSHILHRRSGTPSPSRFLVTEKQEDRSRSSSPRKFVISAESEANSNLREFFITKSIPKDDPGTKRYVLIDTRDEFREVSPLPLPKQFVITQNKATFSQEKLETFKQGIGVQLNSVNLDGQNISDHKEISFDTLEKESIENSSSSISWEYQTTSDYGKSDTSQKVYTQQNAISSSLYDLYAPEPAEFHRDASPYPSLSVSVRKGSITSELLENPNISKLTKMPTTNLPRLT
ncbi:hypothetical protein WA026_000655 [Henosepilachna vigintioctopunctata]|uniref:Uncharacterized protein n=1 Tax=Henosepilachna vigintioctopunctata TaxID=420089 RepID=A0AAW1V877_9CUCU